MIRNKVDLSKEQVGSQEVNNQTVINLSAKNNAGIDLVKDHLKQIMGYKGATEGGFMARRRHLEALNHAAEHLEIGQTQLELHIAGELLAEELRLTQQYLNEITGEFTSDDLLGQIFSSFCIGK